jgi:hypothetical protein
LQGPRYSNRGWQEFKKREYCTGAVLAASGLVKQGKYGITLENPELEVLDDSDGAIESMKVGRLIPVLSADGGGGCWFGEAIDFGCNAGGEKCCQNRYQRICASVTV